MKKITGKHEKFFLYDLIPAPIWTIILFIGLIPGFKPISIDNYYQIAIGKLIMEQGIPHEIPFTVHTAEHLHYMAQQWLFMVFDYGIYSHWGWSGLFLCGIILNMGLIYAVYKMLLVVGKGRRIIAYPSAVFFGSFPFWVGTMHLMRPYYITCILLALEIMAMEHVRRNPKNKLLLVFFLLSILSVNFHSAMWPMLIVMLLPYAAETICMKISYFKAYFLDKKTIPIRFIFCAFIVIIAGGLLNPYGMEAMTYGIRSYSLGILRQYSLEMVSLFYLIPFEAAAVIISMIFNLLLTFRFKVPLAYLFLSLGTGFMALLSYRSVVLFLMFFMVPAVCLSPLIRPLKLKKRRGPIILMLLLALPVYLAGIFRPFAFYSPVPHTLGTSASVVKNDAKEKGISPGPLYGNFNSNYFLLHGITLYMFSSDESFTGKMNGKHDVVAEFLDIDKGELPVEFLEKRYGIRYYLTDKGMRLYDSLQDSPGFTLIYDSDNDKDEYVCKERLHLRIYRGPLEGNG